MTHAEDEQIRLMFELGNPGPGESGVFHTVPTVSAVSTPGLASARIEE